MERETNIWIIQTALENENEISLSKITRYEQSNGVALRSFGTISLRIFVDIANANVSFIFSHHESDHRSFSFLGLTGRRKMVMVTGAA